MFPANTIRLFCNSYLDLTSTTKLDTGHIARLINSAAWYNSEKLILGKIRFKNLQKSTDRLRANGYTVLDGGDYIEIQW
jgi:hypothetical protein